MDEVEVLPDPFASACFFESWMPFTTGRLVARSADAFDLYLATFFFLLFGDLLISRRLLLRGEMDEVLVLDIDFVFDFASSQLAPVSS